MYTTKLCAFRPVENTRGIFRFCGVLRRDENGQNSWPERVDIFIGLPLVQLVSETRTVGMSGSSRFCRRAGCEDPATRPASVRRPTPHTRTVTQLRGRLTAPGIVTTTYDSEAKKVSENGFRRNDRTPVPNRSPKSRS